jgi:aminoglycoside phosphotransferase (APT) family kinase protein
MATIDFDPLDRERNSNAYLTRSLGRQARLVQAERLAKSTREAPWRLDVEVGGVLHSFALRLASPGFEKEYHILRAMESISIRTPRVYGWDAHGDALGVPCYLMDYVHGESLRNSVLAGDEWAEALFIDSVCELQMVTRGQLTAVTQWLGKDETACCVLENAYAFLGSQPPDAVADEAYARLTKTRPDFPETRFSNGDLWLDNFIVRERELAGVIDFANAGFSDPIYEFLLSPFLNPVLRERGLEVRYCHKMGFDAGLLRWYHGLEYLDSWHWVLKTGQPYEQHTAADLRAGLERWLDGQ